MADEKEPQLYPIRVQPLSKEKVWGGTRIAARFEQSLPADRPIGEVWILWDQLVVSNGPFRGTRLAELVRDHPVSLLGRRAITGPEPVFPLLIKFVDASDTLSVQVHPDDAYAQAHEGEPFGKAEVWVVLDADPDARLIHGVKRPLTRADARRAIEAGRLEDELEYITAFPGDVIMNAPGTVHALGGGVLLYELQQSSDLTYRLYDWDRQDPNRPLHIDKALDVARLEPFASHKITPVPLAEAGGTRTILCACEQFAAELLQVRSSIAERPAGESFHALTVLQGIGVVRTIAQPSAEVGLAPGETVLMPASIEEYEIEAGGGSEPLEVIKAYVPNGPEGIADPLRDRDIPDADIDQLRGLG